ncbi:hypothetical protein Tco_0923662 [Tanacetum coccineum]|uniref:Uncharacterized protein n=1 Tax=Tanacetum coccineum TaxID=301880 RepID=A0ABQ5D3Z2_9ASTR
MDGRGEGSCRVLDSASSSPYFSVAPSVWLAEVGRGKARKDFENEFPAIVYNDALTSKSDFLTEPTISPQHTDEFNLKDEISLSECDEEEQNVLNFNDQFPFNVIYPNDSKSDKDNDDDKVDIEHSSGDLSIKPLPDNLAETMIWYNLKKTCVELIQAF